MLHPLEDAFVNPAFIPRLATFKNGFGSDWEVGSLPVAEDECCEQRSRENPIRGNPERTGNPAAVPVGAAKVLAPPRARGEPCLVEPPAPRPAAKISLPFARQWGAIRLWDSKGTNP